MIKKLNISPIQEKAIRELLKLKTITYKELLEAAFDRKNLIVPMIIPALSVLTYKEAQAIIEYGNTIVT